MVTRSSPQYFSNPGITPPPIMPPARRPLSVEIVTVLLARSGGEEMRFLLPAGIFALMRSVGPADFAKVVAKHLEEDRLGPTRRDALLSLAVIIGALES